MAAFLLKRLAHAILVIVGVSLVVFVLSHLSGDPVSLLVSPDTPLSVRREIRHQLGLDRPLPVQYGLFLVNALHGNFGESIRGRVPATSLVLQAIPNTLQLSAFAITFALLLGIPIGIVSALRHNSAIDFLGMTVSLLGQSIPSFWLGILLIIFVGLDLKLLPIAGHGTFAQLIMPGVTLGSFLVAVIARLTRSSMLEVLRQDYMRTGRSKGLAGRVLVRRHALRAALIPIVSALGVQVSLLLGGAVITEQLFTYPGIGWLAVNAIYNRDFPVVQAVVFFASLMVVL
ncbi:MAG: ABC transporter permease, partial [Chloroflexota bacterium]